MLSFSVCPHDLEKGELEKWKGFAEKLSRDLGISVDFQPIASFMEEKQRLEEGNFFDLYFANPFSAVELYLKGYKPLAKLKGQRDRYFIFYRDLPEEGPIKVATALLKPLGFLVLQLDMDRVEIELCGSWKDVVERVESCRAHAGIIYEEVWQELEEEKREKFRLLDRFLFESSHIFMAKPEIEGILRPYFSGQDFEPADHILQKLIRTYTDFDHFYRLWARVKAFSLLEKLRGVGLILYWEEGIALVNDYALQALEYTREELTSKPLEELVSMIIHPSQRDIVLRVVRERIRGEQFTYNYGELTFISKRGRKVYTYTSSATVPYGDNKYGGLVIFVDITKRKRLEALYRVLREVNFTITTSLFEEELFEKICKILLENLDFRFVTLVRIDRGGTPEPYRVCGQTDSLPEDIIHNYRVDSEIYIQPEIRSSEEHQHLLNSRVESFCSITLRSPEDRTYVLSLYSSEPYFFEEEIRDILYELKHDLEFALQRLYDWRKAFIIKGALDRSSTWLVVTDKDGVITYVNDAVCRISGYSREELIGMKTSIFKSGFHDQSFYRDLWKTIKSGKEFVALFVNRKKNGETFYLEQHIYPLELPGGIIRYVSIGRDITREVELSEEIKRLSSIDPMTGLLNRESFENMVDAELQQSGVLFAFILVDLYGTGKVNQRFGTKAGDMYVQSFAELLRKEFKDARFMGRLYGDKFGILVPVKQEKDVFLIEERLHRLMDAYLDVGEKIPVSINAGIALYPTNAQTFSELYSKAKLALNKAKSLGEGKIIIADKSLEKKSEDFIFAMSLVKSAIEEELFTLYFQPYFELETLIPRGFEALVRIVDRQGKVYTPGYFIDYLERSRYLRSFEGWLVREAISAAEKINLPVSINLSASTLKDVGFLKTFLSMPHSPVVIEITERTILELGEDVLEVLERLRREKVVKIAMDDFGTGYSALSQLTKLPVDILKIDMSFVRNMIDNRRIRAIVRNTIALARDLGITTLAEGIETEPQLRMLQGMGCDLVQGFLLGKPMPIQEVMRFLDEGTKRHAQVG